MSLVVSLKEMRDASTAWYSAADRLRTASEMAVELKISRLQAGIFQIPWDKYIYVANYIADRLNEGAAEAESIGAVLRDSADTYEREDRAVAASLDGSGPVRGN